MNLICIFYLFFYQPINRQFIGHMCYFYSWLILEFKLAHIRVVILWLNKAMSYHPYSVVVIFFFLFTLKDLFLVLSFCKKHNPLNDL